MSTTTTYRYFSDGSYRETVITSAATGWVSTTIYNVNAQGQLTQESVETASSTTNTSYSYYASGSEEETQAFTQNADGSQSSATHFYNPNGTVREIQTVSADGSQVQTTYQYAADGSYQEVVTTTPVTPADGTPSQTIENFNALGELTQETVYTPTGQTTTTYSYYSNGTKQEVQETAQAADGSRSSATYFYNPNGSYEQITKQTVSADGSQVNTNYQYAPDGSYQETVTTMPVTPADGTPSQTTENVNALGELTQETVNTPTGSTTTTYSYFPNRAEQEVQQTTQSYVNGSRSSATYFYNANGSYQQITKQTVAADGSQVNTNYQYAPDGSYQETVSTMPVTPADGTPSQTTENVNALGELTQEAVSTPTGWTNTTYSYYLGGAKQEVQETTQNANGSSSATYYYNPDGTYQQIQTISADGSRVNTNYQYNPDGSYQETINSMPTTPADGTPSLTTENINALGELTQEAVNTPTGLTTTTYSYFPDGTKQVVQETTQNYANGSETSATYFYNPDGTYQQIQTISADGSRVNTNYQYNPDGSYQETINSMPTTPADGTPSLTTENINALGQLTQETVSTPTGQTTTTYSYYPNGSEQQVLVTAQNADGYSNSVYDYNPDGSLQQSVKNAVATNGVSTDTTDNYNSDGSYQETVVSSGDHGVVLNQNTYALAADGSSYTDTWSSSQDGSHGTYSWNASTSDYQAAWYDNSGVSWSDNYQYAAGGSPQSGGSYTETYASSDGSQGTRQYDAATGLASISWDSAATGSLSGTSSTAVGFVGLQNEGELTNTQSDLNFFNPAASSGFSSFLSAAETHS